VSTGTRQLVLSEVKTKVDLTKQLEEHVFRFDSVHGEMSSNRLIYEQEIKPLIERVLEGRSINCFAFGQTGSGKTFTMAGGRGEEGVQEMAVLDLYHCLPRDTDLFMSFF
jgi:kinesin family protein 2/24